MRILMVNDLPLDRGAGTEVYIARLMAALRGNGDEVELFTRPPHLGPARALDVWDPFARRALRALGSEFQPDVVHHHHVLRELSVSVLGVPAGRPCVLTVHDLRLLGGQDRPVSSPLDRLKRSKSAFDRAVARSRVDVAMAVSGDIARRLRQAGFPSVRQVPVFAPDEGPPGVSAGRATDVVFVGRLNLDKGTHVLIDAFARVASRHPGTTLLIVGDGPERRALEAQAAASGAPVTFTGWLDPTGVAAAWARARVVAVPSLTALRAEGMPLTAIEAAMAARPLVTSDDPGLIEFAGDAGAAIVTRAGSVDELAAALAGLLHDPALADRMGAAARDLAVRRHGPEAGVGAVREAYAEAIGTVG